MPCSLASKVSSTSVAPSVPVVSVTGVLAASFLVWSTGWVGELLGDLLDLERRGLLGLVRVLGAGVHLELAEDLAAEAVLGEHPPHRLLDGPARVLLEQLAVGGRRQTARVARVPVGQLLGRLVAGERDLARVHHD